MQSVALKVKVEAQLLMMVVTTIPVVIEGPGFAALDTFVHKAEARIRLKASAFISKSFTLSANLFFNPFNAAGGAKGISVGISPGSSNVSIAYSNYLQLPPKGLPTF
jgi:hypothetical protein